MIFGWDVVYKVELGNSHWEAMQQDLGGRDVIYSERKCDLNGVDVWRNLNLDITCDGWYPLHSNGLVTRMVVHFASPGPLSAIHIFSSVASAANMVQPRLVSVRLIHMREDEDREILYKTFQPVTEGVVSLEVAKQDRLLWDKAIFEFAAVPGVINVKPVFVGKTSADLPCWDECMDRQKMRCDFVLHCADNVEVHISSAVLMAACELFSDCRYAFKDAQSRSFDLTGADGFHSSVVLAVKQIIETREMDSDVLVQDGLGAEVVRLLYFFLVTGRERVWALFHKVLPSLSVEQFKVVVDLACDYGDMETLRVFGGFTKDAEALEYVANKMKQHIHRFDVVDPFCFVCSLREAKP